MPDPRINLKNPVLAGILAFLLPGAGHLYQGRIFKSVVYAVCIWGTYLTGNVMSGWRAVQAPRLGEVRSKIPLSLKFAAQAGVGLPGLYAMYQTSRASQPGNREVSSLSAPLDAPCEGPAELGTFGQQKASGIAQGRVSLKPKTDEFGKSISGVFEGTFRPKGEEPRKVEWGLENVVLARKIQPGLKRLVAGTIRDEASGEKLGEMRAFIPRSFLDAFGAPATPHEEVDLHGELGKFHELAMVLTWIAGLLNVLAIWDAVDGPAYGYGDETDKPAPGENPTPPSPTPTGKALPTPT